VGGTSGSPNPQLAVELLPRILVVGDAIDVGDREPRRLEAVPERAAGDRRIVLDTREPLLLCRRDELAASEHAARGVVEVGGDTDDNEPHLRSS